MSEHETIADIIAEMRALSNPISDGIIAIDGRRIADSLEAAWKREKATAENPSAVGDCVKMREALEWIAHYTDNEDKMDDPRCADGHILADKARAALAAPARNCDLARDWLQDLYCKFKPPASVRREMPPEWVDAVIAFCKWLVAQAKDAKGVNDEQK